ncbi:MAG: hypothetical protein JJV98_09380 [Desulfosarcina sp.]|nr:hypothetical protein [Desulfobacterales bacterium]
MITGRELRRKALRAWNSGVFLRGRLRGVSIFPLEIRFGKPSGRQLSEAFADVRDWITHLKQESTETRKYGCTIVYKAVDHRQLGRQELPDRIFFENKDHWLGYIGKGTDWEAFEDIVRETEQRQPPLLALLYEKPLKILTHRRDWSALLTVCEWFQAHPRPGLYLRQLDIAAVDTKFIESRKGILMEMLNRVLAPGALDPAVSGPARHGFERRYGLLYDQPLVRLRIIDDTLAPAGLCDLCLPVSDVLSNDFDVKTVYITENKINGLAFPPAPAAMVIFGLGYGVELLADIGWLREKNIWYWGDIDTHGFAILSQIRSYFPQTRSLLMDRETFLEHRHLWGKEHAEKRCQADLSNLTAAEKELYEVLKADRFGSRLRLEQERIAYSHLLQELKRINKGLKVRLVHGHVDGI